MTALCGGGSSGPKPGVNEVVIFTSSQLGSFLNNKGGLWATIAVGALGVLTYHATELCSSDPPAQPTLTAADYQALLNLEPFDEFTTALGKLKDLVTIALWYDLCQCTSVATPAPSTGILNPPAGVTLPDYGLTPCAQPRLRLNIRGNQTVFSDANNITQEAFPNLRTTVSQAFAADRPAQVIAELPSSWTSWHQAAQLVSGTTPTTEGYTVTLSLYGADRTYASSGGTTVVGTGHPTNREPPVNEEPVTSVARYFALNAMAGPNITQTGTIDYALTVNCSGQSVTQPGCCSDPVLYSLINALTQQVTLVRRDTELLQRYGLPFAYVPGPIHSGLQLSGSADMGRSVGLKIDVTAFPPSNQQMLGQPPYIFDLGWISVLTPDGLLDEIRLTRTSTTWMSKLIPSSTRLGWGLREGVTANVTELRPEP